MAKALFGSVVTPAQLLAEENAVLRTRVRRLQQELTQLRAERDAEREAAIAQELRTLADDTQPALA